MAEKWMQEAFSKNKGKLHRRLNVKQGEKIPSSRIAKATRSKDLSLKKEAVLARTGARIARRRKNRGGSRR